MHARWLKMIYGPKEAEALGEFRQSVKDPTLWRLVHQTLYSQRHVGLSCPGGVDVGTIDYLKSIGFTGNFAIRYTNAPPRTPEVFEIPFETLLRHRRSGIVKDTMTPKGRRNRVFVAQAEWTAHKWDPVEYLRGGKLDHGDTLYLDKDGNEISSDTVPSEVA